MEALNTFFQFLTTSLATKTGLSVAILLALVIVSLFFHHLVRRSVRDLSLRQKYWGLIRIFTLVIGVIMVFGVWLEEVKTVGLLMTGFIAAGLLTFKEVWLGIAGRMALAIGDHYSEGDRVTINGVSGDIVNIGLLYSWMAEVDHKAEQSTGKIILIPHMWLLLHHVANHTLKHDYIWEHIEFYFPLHSDTRRVITVMEEEANRYLGDNIQKAERSIAKIRNYFAVKTAPATPKAYLRSQFQAPNYFFLVVSLRITIKDRDKREVISQLTQNLVERFHREKIPLLSAEKEPAAPPPRKGRKKG